MCAYSWHGSTVSWWAAAACRWSQITPGLNTWIPDQRPRVAGVVVGCGGVAVFDDDAEVKHMYTRPAARGRGVAKALLYIIQDEARRANKSVLRLETGTYQREAIGLYERMGFRPRGPFGPYAAMQARNIETSLFFEKILP